MSLRTPTSVVLRLAAATTLAALALLPAPGISASMQSVKVDSAAEAWYRDAPQPARAGDAPELPEAPDPCTLPVGCPAGPPPQPSEASAGVVYPLGTLHIEATGGSTTAHAYITPDLSYVPVGATILRGTLTLPVSERQDAGNVRAEDAKLIGCLTTEPVTDNVYGGTGNAPTYDCDAVTQPATYRKEDHAFLLDLGPFLDAWSSGTPNLGVALVPAPRVGPQASWHVAINGDEIEKGKGAAAEVYYRVPPVDTPTVESPEVTGGPVGASGLSGPGGISGPVTEPGSPRIGTPPEAAPEAAPAAGSVQRAPFALLSSPWYTYRGVVFLPLAFLVALTLTGRSLTKPLSRRA